MDLETPFRTLLAEMNIDLYDVELTNGALNVTVTREGGIDLDTLTSANHTLSTWLDEHDPVAGRYTLDVSSPGLERRLRLPRHFQSAVGEIVTFREIRGSEPTRRLEGVLSAATEDNVTIVDNELGELTVSYDNLERARTVFVWGATAKPSPSKGRATGKTATTKKKTTSTTTSKASGRK